MTMMKVQVAGASGQKPLLRAATIQGFVPKIGPEAAQTE